MHGTFKFVDTLGLPLEFVLHYLDDNNIQIDWMDFYSCALKCGWNERTILTKIDMALGDVKGRDYADIVMGKLKIYINKEI